MKARGRFVSIEGIEGAGKTTQVDLLHRALNDAGISCDRTREPGGSAGGELIRRLFIEHEWDGAAESFLLMASRRDHVMNRIKPVLDSGAWVVSDRFSLTTFAYQGYGRGVGLTVLKDMNWLATGGLTPDLSIILDIPSDVGLARARKRSTPDRMERLSVEWFERVRDGFLKLAVRRKATCAVVDATGSPESVHLFVKAVIRDRLEVEL